MIEPPALSGPDGLRWAPGFEAPSAVLRTLRGIDSEDLRAFCVRQGIEIVPLDEPGPDELPLVLDLGSVRAAEPVAAIMRALFPIYLGLWPHKVADDGSDPLIDSLTDPTIIRAAHTARTLEDFCRQTLGFWRRDLYRALAACRHDSFLKASIFAGTVDPNRLLAFMVADRDGVDPCVRPSNLRAAVQRIVPLVPTGDRVRLLRSTWPDILIFDLVTSVLAIDTVDLSAMMSAGLGHTDRWDRLADVLMRARVIRRPDLPFPSVPTISAILPRLTTPSARARAVAGTHDAARIAAAMHNCAAEDHVLTPAATGYRPLVVWEREDGPCALASFVSDPTPWIAQAAGRYSGPVPPDVEDAIRDLIDPDRAAHYPW